MGKQIITWLYNTVFHNNKNEWSTGTLMMNVRDMTAGEVMPFSGNSM